MVVIVLMKVLFKILVLILLGFSIFLIWPQKSLKKETKVLASIRSEEPQKLVLVYNANSDNWSVTKDFFHKMFSPETYPCQLCALTFGPFMMKKDWKQFLDSLPYKKEFLHKDEFVKKYSLNFSNYPVIFAAGKSDIWVLVSKVELESCNNLDQLKQLTLLKLKKR